MRPPLRTMGTSLPRKRPLKPPKIPLKRKLPRLPRKKVPLRRKQGTLNRKRPLPRLLTQKNPRTKANNYIISRNVTRI